MADDEPLDDARAVATAAAAAAARVVETLAREARDRAAREQVTIERAQDQQRAAETLARLDNRMAPDETAKPSEPARYSVNYDSPKARQQRDIDRAAAGVPEEARQVRATADLANGTAPSLKASAGQVQERARKVVAAQPARDMTRAR